MAIKVPHSPHDFVNLKINNIIASKNTNGPNLKGKNSSKFRLRWFSQ